MLDKNRHLTTGSFDTDGERGNIKQDEVLCLLQSVAAEDVSLDSSTKSDGLIQVDYQDLFGELLDGMHTGRAADEDLSIFESLSNLLYGLNGKLKWVRHSSSKRAQVMEV